MAKKPEKEMKNLVETMEKAFAAFTPEQKKTFLNLRKKIQEKSCVFCTQEIPVLTILGSSINGQDLTFHARAENGQEFIFTLKPGKGK